jgi:hypothetical protein
VNALLRLVTAPYRMLGRVFADVLLGREDAWDYPYSTTPDPLFCDFDCERRGGPHGCMCPPAADVKHPRSVVSEHPDQLGYELAREQDALWDRLPAEARSRIDTRPLAGGGCPFCGKAGEDAGLLCDDDHCREI